MAIVQGLKFKRRVAWILCLCIFMNILAGCSSGSKANVFKVSKSATYFGTLMTITLYGDEKETAKLIDEAFEEVGRLEQIFSAKLADSELSKLNITGYNNAVKVSDELFEVVSIALKYNALSDGALDISIGRMVDLWAIGTDKERIPSMEELAYLKGIDGCSYIKLDSDNKTIMYTDERVKLDLGAVAKGYAADIVKAFVLDRDDKAYGILNFGGNVMTIGVKADGSAWNVAITDPFSPDTLCATVSVEDIGVVTSGNYERYFEKDGVRYHHILDATTGYPSRSGVASVSIIGGSSVDCDALSTACFILGVDKGMKLIESLEGFEAVFIDESGQEHYTAGMKNYNLKMQ